MQRETIKVCIGYDPREAVAYHVLAHSILSRSSMPVAFVPIALSTLKDEMWRERNPLQSTDFSFSRFLAPYLCGYEGWSIFMDSDVLCIDDIAKLWALRDDRYAVMCVQHDHRPKEETKFLGAVQTQYEKKNWSSVMLFNNARCKALTLEYVNESSGLELHRFKWLSGDEEIGALPQGWNHLVGYSDTAFDDIHMLHYTEGGPYFKDFKETDYADLWFKERDAMNQVIEKHLAET